MGRRDREWSLRVLTVALVLIVEGSAVNVLGLAEALAGKTQDGRAIKEAIDRGGGLAVGGEETRPFRKTDVGRQNDRAVAVSGRDNAVEVIGMPAVQALISEFVDKC